MNTKFVRSSILREDYKITRHASLRRLERDISIEEIERSLLNGEIIERNPGDKPYPSFLILGCLRSGDPLHIKCSKALKKPKLRIVTIYEPANEEWEDNYKIRKKKRRKG